MDGYEGAHVVERIERQGISDTKEQDPSFNSDVTRITDSDPPVSFRTRPIQTKTLPAHIVSARPSPPTAERVVTSSPPFDRPTKRVCEEAEDPVSDSGLENRKSKTDEDDDIKGLAKRP